MVFAAGQSGNPAGRPQGIPDKRVAVAREAIAHFVDNNAVRLTEWLDRIAEKDPKQAFDAFMSVVEYHIPKLARSEIENKLSIAFEPLVIRQLPSEDNKMVTIDNEQPVDKKE
jgi:hypothetical protein